MIVVDTNILAYLLIEGDRTEVCRKVLWKDPEWCAPFLWRSEFRNVLTTHMHHAGMSFDGATARMGESEKLLVGREYSISSKVVLELTSANSVAAYDAEFVCLANKLERKLITTDKPLLKTFPDVAVTPEEFAATTLYCEQDVDPNT
ncbi:MAG TPA: PIN domain-containing protein [Verrucomicrobiales bacterium]|nr:PIN domain-containing protein [Verrucomicrobiales bacterium]